MSTPALADAFVIAFALVSHVAFHLGDGYVVPTQVLFVPMLLLLPTPLVPALVLLGAGAAAATRVGWVPQRAPLRSRLNGVAAPRAVLAELVQVWRVDLMLAPTGPLTAIAAAPHPAAALLVLPLIFLISLFAREREAPTRSSTSPASSTTTSGRS